ncbi:MAG: CoA pyrophosphatase [Nitriliruptor sp.]|uniref:CoA pyrophosphatase n=1 Tax=Nitriliruptor sp. TaxID=2448056 RepID=UPI0034A00DE3
MRPAAEVTLDEVAAQLASRADDRAPADPAHPWQAAVAVVLAPGTAGLDIAFIERVVRPGDRWSGQMALPGGKREPADPDLATTAARETAEEVGLDVGEPIGRLADQRGRVSKGMVAAFVFGLDDRPALRPQPSEVAAADWIALSWLYDPANVVRRRWVGVPFPGIAHRDRVIWGLTHRILDDLGSSLGLALPRP